MDSKHRVSILTAFALQNCCSRGLSYCGIIKRCCAQLVAHKMEAKRFDTSGLLHRLFLGTGQELDGVFQSSPLHGYVFVQQGDYQYIISFCIPVHFYGTWQCNLILDSRKTVYHSKVCLDKMCAVVREEIWGYLYDYIQYSTKREAICIVMVVVVGVNAFNFPVAIRNQDNLLDDYFPSLEAVQKCPC